MANNNNFVKMPNQDIKSSRAWYSNVFGMFSGQRRTRTIMKDIQISIPVHNATNDMTIKVGHMEIEDQVDVGLIPGPSDYNGGHPVNVSRYDDRNMRIQPVPQHPLEYRRPAAIEAAFSEDPVQPTLTTQQIDVSRYDDRTTRIQPVPHRPLDYRRPAAIEAAFSEDPVQPTLTTQQSEHHTLKHPKYASYLERLESLKHSDWSTKEQQILAEEGFFCSPHHAQNAACFCCGLIVDSVVSTRLKTHPIDSRSACAFYKHMTGGHKGSTTCFDRVHERNGWIPCKLLECLLCESEPKMGSEFSAPETFAQLN